VTEHPMMECGHAANAVCNAKSGVKYDPPIPSCVICSCIEIAKTPPSLNRRKAKCDYFGRTWGRNSGPIYGGSKECSRTNGCGCIVDSDSETLPFFEHRPNKDFDKFYCGCHGWD
jgi:hypothetical protein